MPIVYGPGASDAVRTRLPGDAGTITAGQGARDIDDRFGSLVPLQLVEVLNEIYTEPMTVVMASRPKMLICGVSLTLDPQGSLIGMGCACEWTWLGNSVSVRRIQNMNIVALPSTRYNFVFLGVG